ncbi:MAG: hypothetical protein J6S75_08315 [Thermoguttaceae bacterium]|nr:hypothetical protein [Thermoguttaceae bacterium]
MDNSENKFYNASNPFDGGGALAAEIQKINRRLAQTPESDPNREPLQRRAGALRLELLEVMRPLLNKCLDRFGREALSRFRGRIKREDLIQDGALAILRAADAFIPAAGRTFGAFACQCVSHAMRNV